MAYLSSNEVVLFSQCTRRHLTLSENGRVSQDIAGSIWQEMDRGRGRWTRFAHALSPLRDFGVRALPSQLAPSRTNLRAHKQSKKPCIPFQQSQLQPSVSSFYATNQHACLYRPKEKPDLQKDAGRPGALVDIPREWWTPELKTALAQRLCLHLPVPRRIHACQFCPLCPSVLSSAQCNPAMAPDLV